MMMFVNAGLNLIRDDVMMLREKRREERSLRALFVRAVEALMLLVCVLRIQDGVKTTKRLNYETI